MCGRPSKACCRLSLIPGLGRRCSTCWQLGCACRFQCAHSLAQPLLRSGMQHASARDGAFAPFVVRHSIEGGMAVEDGDVSGVRDKNEVLQCTSELLISAGRKAPSALLLQTLQAFSLVIVRVLILQIS